MPSTPQRRDTDTDETNRPASSTPTEGGPPLGAPPASLGAPSIFPPLPKPSTSERLATLEEKMESHEERDRERHGEVLRMMTELRGAIRDDAAGLRKLLLVQMGVMLVVIAILGGIVGVKVVLDGTHLETSTSAQ